MKDLATKFNLRLEIVLCAREHGLSETSRRYETTRKTVRKWLRRHETRGLDGLKDQKRTPKNIPHKMDKQNEAEVLRLRNRLHTWGARSLKNRFDIGYSHTAIHRVLKQGGLVGQRRRRWRKRKDLSEMKKGLKLFERSQIDTKDLIDIPNYWIYKRRFGLPRYEYTWRELSLGATFFAYADENTSTSAARFARYVIEHLKTYGIETGQTASQTDNGSEYIGSVNKKTSRPSAFEKVLLKHRVHHGRIPPRASYLQGDVETVHKLIEEEFYDVEGFLNDTDFLGKAYAYGLYFNYLRKNRNRDNLSPVEILKKRFPSVDDQILNLPPIRLEALGDLELAESGQGGYDVPLPLQISAACACVKPYLLLKWHG
jgi:transposase